MLRIKELVTVDSLVSLTHEHGRVRIEVCTVSSHPGGSTSFPAGSAGVQSPDEEH